MNTALLAYLRAQLVSITEQEIDHAESGMREPLLPPAKPFTTLTQEERTLIAFYRRICDEQQDLEETLVQREMERAIDPAVFEQLFETACRLEIVALWLSRQLQRRLRTRLGISRVGCVITQGWLVYEHDDVLRECAANSLPDDFDRSPPHTIH